MNFETISVVGLGYIGLPTAAAFAARRKKVIGVDVIIALLVAIILFSSLGQEFGLVGAMIAAVVTEVVLYVSWMSFIFLKIHQTRVTRLLISGFLGAIFVTLCGGAMWKIYT